jgi:O-antigen/teichoic acid export membrane protein
MGQSLFSLLMSAPVAWFMTNTPGVDIMSLAAFVRMMFFISSTWYAYDNRKRISGALFVSLVTVAIAFNPLLVPHFSEDGWAWSILSTCVIFMWFSASRARAYFVERKQRGLSERGALSD